MINIKKESLNLEKGLLKEWVITNGIGGFASSTVIGANTRKYHGLLIAPFTPPSRRMLILSKLDESIEINGEKINLFTNICKEYISHGYNYQTEFIKDNVPTFIYKIGDVEIKKTICMEHGKNLVGVYYKIKNGKNEAKFKLAPIVNYRDFHSMNTNHKFYLRQEINENKVKLIIDGNEDKPIYMQISEGMYDKHINDQFYNMFYIEEEKRGFFAEENHAVPGVFCINIEPNEEKEISFICSLEEIKSVNVKELINKENIRINDIFTTSLLISEKLKKTKKELEEEEFLKTLLLAADNFIVKRQSFNLHTILAGYPWFLDWGRDSLIAFEGLLLVTNRFNIAKEVLLTYIKDINCGLVPNGYSEYENKPLYNSVDSSLLLFEQIKKYIDYTKDYDFIKQYFYDVLENIIENYIKGIDLDDNNIYLDLDYLLVSGTEYTQNTWMDAKYENFVATPRNGKAVEINAMWYNALKIMEELTAKIDKKSRAKAYKELAEKCKKAFNENFYNKRRKCLYDVIGDKKVRPNQLFALSLSYPVVDPDSEFAKNIIDVVNKKLLNNYGLKTLAKGEENYVDIYEGDSFRRDITYHQGTTWTWLLGLYYNALKNMIKTEKNKQEKDRLKKELEDFIQKVKKTFKKEIKERGCIGSISEMFDSKTPYLPKGAVAQAWSVSEIIRIILKK